MSEKNNVTRVWPDSTIERTGGDRLTIVGGDAVIAQVVYTRELDGTITRTVYGDHAEAEQLMRDAVSDPWKVILSVETP